MPKIFTATGDSVCCLQRIGNKSFVPSFYIFLLPTFLRTAKQKTLKTLFTTGLVQTTLAVSSFLGKFPLNIGTSVFLCF